MKNTFSKISSKLVAGLKSNYPLLLVLTMVIYLNSCKKEMAGIKPSQKIDLKPKTLNYQQFLSDIKSKGINDFNNLDFTKKIPLNNGKVISQNEIATNSIELITDSIKMINAGARTTYTIPVKLSSKYATNFQNLMIDVSSQKLSALLLTFKPTKKYISAYLNKENPFFSGKISAEEIYFNNVNKKGNQNTTSAIVCNTVTLSGSYDAMCTTGPPFHTYEQGDQCRDFGYPGGAERILTNISVTICDDDGTPVSPPPANNNGGGSTYVPPVNNPIVYPTPPPSYQPCILGNSDPSGDPNGGGPVGPITNPCDGQEQSQGAIAAQTLIDHLPITDGDQELFLKTNEDIASELYAFLNTKMWSPDNKGLVKWAVGYLYENKYTINFEDFKRDFLLGDAWLDLSGLGTDGSGQNMNFDIYFDDIDGEFKFISKSDPNYSNVVNNGTTALPTQFSPATTQLLRQMGKDKGWDVGVSTLEFNRRVGQAFQEATYKLYRSKLNPLQLPRVTYQPQNNVSLWRKAYVGNSGKVVPDWTFDISYGLTSLTLPQHMFYDAKAVNGPLYLSSSKHQIGGYLDVLSRKRVNNAPPPVLVFVTPVNTIISPSILATAISKGVQIRQAFVIVINNKLYLLNSIEITPANDRFHNIPLNLLKIIAGPVDLEYPVNPNNGPDYEELQQ